MNLPTGWSKRRKVLIGVGLGSILLSALVAMVATPAISDIRRARTLLAGPLDDLDVDRVSEGKRLLERASDRLDSFPGKLAAGVPMVGANLRALSAVASGLPPVLDAGIALRDRVGDVEDAGLLDRKRIDIASLSEIGELTKAQAAALEVFSTELEEHLSGMLLPALYYEIEDLGIQVAELADTLGHAGDLLEASDRLFGHGEPRTYLVLLLNNAELRGAGGILAGIGTVTFRGGRISLGDFRSVHDLQGGPLRSVPAPAEYERRYSTYKANTTLWLNVSYSPDVPDVALVAARLYEKVTGIDSDGAFVLDPRGITALLPQDGSVTFPGGESVSVEDLPRFVYSDAYERYSDPSTRQDALLAGGRAAFRSLIQRGLDDEGRASGGAAVGAGHIGFVSFDERESVALDALGFSHGLQRPVDDVVRVAVQNMGDGGSEGTKLDYWVKRDLAHACDLTVTPALCATEVELTNEVPRGLTRYVAGKPYGLVRNYIETYVPLDAHLLEVTINGEDAAVRVEEQAGQQSIGVYAEIAPGEKTSVFVRYEVPFDGNRFTIEAIPQPLAKDARFDLDVALPPGWKVRGPGRLDGGVVELSAPLDRTLQVELVGTRPPGLTGWWEGLRHFWSEPLFGR